MPNIAKVLKEEIARIARKEVKSAVGKVHKPTVKLRKQAADFKRRVALLEKAVKQFQASVLKVAQAAPAPEPAKADTARITAKGMRSLRRKLRLSGLEFAKLLGVTGQAVYNWEKGEGALRVRATTRAAILAVRDLGAREAKLQLDGKKQAKAAGSAKRSATKRRKTRGR